MENREQWLKENGFKKKWFVDKSGYWWVKPVKIGEFKGYFYYEERFCQLYIDCFRHQVDDLYTCEDAVIWKGTWNQFKNKVKNHGKF